jgi:HlyD family secretion protein
MPAIAPRLPGGRKTLIILVAAILIMSIVGLNMYRSRQQVPVEVVSATAQIEKMGTTILASGSIELLEKQEVYAPSDRLVREVPIRVGDQVKKGQIIAILEADSESLSLLDAQARLAEQEVTYQKYFYPTAVDVEIAEADYQQAELAYQNSLRNADSNEKLYAAGAVSLQELSSTRSQLAADEALYLKAKKEWNQICNGLEGAERRSQEAAYHRSQEAVKLAEQNLAQFVVPARIDGQVMAVQISAGDVTSAGQHLITIGDPHQLEVKVGIGEYDAARVKKGQEVQIEAAAFPERQFQGQVMEVSQKAFINKNSQSQQVEIPVRIAVDSEQKGLLPGFTVDVKIITVPEKDRLVVPYEAVAEKDDQSYIYIIEKNQAKRIPVQIGLEGDLSIEIISGLEKGATVILNPPDDLEDGQAVKPIIEEVQEGSQL